MTQFYFNKNDFSNVLNSIKNKTTYQTDARKKIVSEGLIRLKIKKNIL